MADVFKVAAKAITTTDTVTLFTVGASATAILRSLTVCNTSTASTASCDLIFAVSGSDVYVRRYTSVSAAATFDAVSHAAVVGPSGSLKVQASPADSIHIVASYLESQ